MTSFRHDRRGLILIILGIVCASEMLCAQDFPGGPNSLPTIIDRKQAAKLVVNQTPPEYPPIAKVNFIQGQVQVELTVDPKGRVTNAHVVDGDAVLAQAALTATRQWTYHPLETATGPEGFATTVIVKFSLHYKGTDLTPRRAEQDFLRQVKPPQALRPLESVHAGGVVHVRLLVDDHGHVIDMDGLPLREQMNAARETLRRWAFRPAHWGSLAVASYFEADFSLGSLPLTQASAISGGR